MTQDELREVVARAIFNGMMPSWHWDSQWYEGERAGAYRAFDAAIRAIEAAGYAVVKKEPDDAMLWAACAAHDFPSVYMGGPRLGWAPTAKRVYRSMLEAAASPPLAKET